MTVALQKTAKGFKTSAVFGLAQSEQACINTCILRSMA
jgi:hypothetical protein